MNVLLFSADPVALDTVYAALIHLDPATVPTCVRGAKGGIGVMDEGLIDVLTPDGVLTVSQAREKYGNAQFDVFRGTMKKGLLPKLMPLLPFLQHRPKVDLKKCIGCGVCQEACPVPEKAVPQRAWEESEIRLQEVYSVLLLSGDVPGEGDFGVSQPFE